MGASQGNQDRAAYRLAYYGTKDLLTELFSIEEANGFDSSIKSAFIGIPIKFGDAIQSYKISIHGCITRLDVYRERIQNFWEINELETETKSTIVPFVSMSFDKNDKDINEYVTGILEALQIDFETGERYYKGSIPEKVQSRIRSSDLFISILVKRDKLEGGGYAAPSWLHKELGIAQGVKKDVIAWVERDIKDIAGLNSEKEVIYFKRNDANEIEKATIKFLEALKEHKLI